VHPCPFRFAPAALRNTAGNVRSLQKVLRQHPMKCSCLTHGISGSLPY